MILGFHLNMDLVKIQRRMTMGITKKELEEIRQKKIEIDRKEAEEFWEKNKEKIIDYFNAKLIQQAENDLEVKLGFSMNKLFEDLNFEFNNMFQKVITIEHLKEEYTDIKVSYESDYIYFDLR